MKHRRLRVSDHAVVRYLERIRGLDIDALRDEIAGKAELALDYPGSNGVLRDGHLYRVVNSTVITVQPRQQKDKRLGR